MTAWISSPLLTTTGLTVERAGRRLVEGLDLTLFAGQVLAVVGPSGCGKSSLLATLAGWSTPVAGTVRVASKHLPAVALLPQDLGLAAARTALANAASGALPRRPFWRHPWGPITADRADALELLTRLGIGSRAHVMVRRLSGGERQRCAVARTILARPSVLLFDEPVSQLDDASGRSTLALIREQSVQHGALVITALHQRHLVEGFADLVLESVTTASQPTCVWQLSAVPSAKMHEMTSATWT